MHVTDRCQTSMTRMPMGSPYEGTLHLSTGRASGHMPTLVGDRGLDLGPNIRQRL